MNRDKYVRQKSNFVRRPVDESEVRSDGCRLYMIYLVYC